MTETEVIQAVAEMPSYILEDDIRLYHKYMQPLTSDKVVVDVGTGLGKSVVAMGLSNPEPTILTFDNGIYPIDRNWVKSLKDYEKFITLLFERHKLENILFLMEDILTHDFSDLTIDLFHVDGEKYIEEEILEYVFPHIKKSGIILIRNADRFSKKGLDFIVDKTEFLEQMGKIQVVQKV